MIEEFLPAIIIAAVALFLIRLLIGGRKAKGKSGPKYMSVSHRKAPAKKPTTTSSRFRAVSCSGHCGAVREIREKRFLEREAPSFPLPGCSEPRCQCVYIHHEDRRSGRKDRRGLAHASELYEGTANRRQRLGRRTTDLAMA